MNIEVHTADRSGYEEVFVTSTAVAADEADGVFAAIATALATRGAEPFAERVYGGLRVRERLLASRRRQFTAHDLDAQGPVSFVDGSPPGGGDFAGVQVEGVRSENGSVVRTVHGGRLWQGPSFRMLHLFGITGSPGDPVSVQAQQMFAAAAAAARTHGFDYRQSVRTRIYLARLLDWYGEFNRVRSAAYRAYDFAFPASTGIQGRAGDAECAMDALLVDGVRCDPIDRTARQGPARTYGSAFSRAMQIAHEGGVTVHVSGTASIDPAGRSLHPDDPAAQFAETLLDIGAVLEQAGMSLTDIRQATLFCTDERAYAACQQVRRLLGVPAFPTVAVQADVCRPELLVEMEVIACR